MAKPTASAELRSGARQLQSDGVAPDQMRAFIERSERMEEEK